MKLISVAYKYLRMHLVLTGAILFLIAACSFLEGASFGMLIPLIQSMTMSTANLFEKLPLVNHLNLSLTAIKQEKVLSLVFLCLFLLIMFKNIVLYYANILIAKLRFGIVRDLRINLMGNLLEYDTKFFDSIKTGHIINNINAETERMGDFINAVLRLVSIIGRVLAYILLLCLISWKSSIVLLLLITTVLVPIELIMKKIKRIGERISQATADYNYKLIEILSGIRLIKERGTENLEKNNFKTAVDRTYHYYFESSKNAYLIIPLSETFIFGLIVICFVFLINGIKIDTTKSFPFIATYLLVLARMLTQLNALNDARSEAMKNLSAFIRYEQMYDENGKKTIKSGDKEIKKFSDSIEFKDISFSYIDKKQILKDINFRVPKGKMTALVGASGVGKSTIVNLIPRFYDVDLGEILVDGINLKKLSLKEWRIKIGFVSQDVFIFNTSVKNNIAYGHDEILEEEIIKAAKTANAHNFIMELPDGYDTILGERGIKLSGGQKQRISIARSILNNPEILILDEATSSLDTETEKLITQAIHRLAKDRTTIAIAHRLSTILYADNIIVLDEGRVVEEGGHEDLLKKNGLYKKLYDIQFNV